MPLIVFVCDGQFRLASMASLFLRRSAQQRRLNRIHAVPATFTPLLPSVHPAIAMAMAEVSFDLEAHRPQPFTRQVSLFAHRIIWLSADGQPPGLPIEHWELFPSETPHATPAQGMWTQTMNTIHSVDSIESAKAALSDARRLRDAVQDCVERLVDALKHQAQLHSEQLE